MDVIILDTNIVSFLMKGHTLAKIYSPHMTGKLLGVSFMTVGEMFEGAYRQTWDNGKLEVLRSEIKRYLVIPWSPHICEIWGQIRAHRKSQPIAVDDAWIAATALVYQCPLVTHNPNDFQGIADLNLVTEHKT